MKLLALVRSVFQDSARMYIAPLVEAIKGMRAEHQQLGRGMGQNDPKTKP